MKKRQVTVNKTEVLVKEREDKWYVPPSGGIPEYTSEKDPHCPTGQIRKYNEEKKLKADILAQRDKATSSFIKNTLSHSTEEIKWDVNAKSKNDIRSKVKTQEGYVESTILQKIIIREKLLNELQTLLKTQNDVSSCLSEVVELVKAIRFQTLDIIEGIRSWQQLLPTPQAFEYKGYNYLVKMKCDLDFLDLYEEVVEKFCFEFTSNPLAYRGGGNVITGYGTDQRGKSYGQGLLHNYYTSSDEEFLNGLDVQRLLNAEKTIQEEFTRLRREKLSGEELNRMQQTAKQGDVLDRDIFNALSKSVTNLHDIDASNAANNGMGAPAAHSADSPAIRTGKKEKKVRRGSKSTTAINPKKIKQDRIAALQEEAAELKAMLVNVDEKVQFLTDHHHDLLNQRAALDARLKDAKNAGREVQAQHINAEISVNTAVILENSGKVKDLQRESYFINLERKRKLGTAQKLRDEIEDDKRRASLQKKIGAKIKKEGLLAALQSFSTKASVEEIATIGDKALGTRPKTPGNSGGSPPKSAGVSGKRSKEAPKQSKDDTAASSLEGSPTTYDAQDQSRQSKSMYSSASAPQFAPQGQTSSGRPFPPVPYSSEGGTHQSGAYPSQVPPNPGYNSGYSDNAGPGEGNGQAYYDPQDGESEDLGDDEEGEEGADGAEEGEEGEEGEDVEYEYVDGDAEEGGVEGGEGGVKGGEGAGEGYYDSGEELQGERAHQQPQYEYYGDAGQGQVQGQGQLYQQDQWQQHAPLSDNYNYDGSAEMGYGGGEYSGANNNAYNSYPSQEQQAHQYSNGYQEQSGQFYGNAQDPSQHYQDSGYAGDQSYDHQGYSQGYDESVPQNHQAYGEQVYGEQYQDNQAQYQDNGYDYAEPYGTGADDAAGAGGPAELEISPMRQSSQGPHSHSSFHNEAPMPLSPSEASYGSKDSPLGYSYASTAEHSESATHRDHEHDDAHHDLLVGEQLVVTPKKQHKHSLKFQQQQADNEMYISDDDEGHEPHEQEKVHFAVSVGHTGQAGSANPSTAQLTQQDHSSHTFDLSEVSQSPQSTYSPSAFDRSFDSDAGVVEAQEKVLAQDASQAQEGWHAGEDPSRELFLDSSVAEAAYPAGNAYALVKSLKLSPRPVN